MKPALQKRNPGGQAGESPIAPLHIRSPRFSTPVERQAQILAHRFSLPLSTARHVAFLAYGGGSHE
jgi:hypothetical protein